MCGLFPPVQFSCGRSRKEIARGAIRLRAAVAVAKAASGKVRPVRKTYRTRTRWRCLVSRQGRRREAAGKSLRQRRGGAIVGGERTQRPPQWLRRPLVQWLRRHRQPEDHAEQMMW